MTEILFKFKKNLFYQDISKYRRHMGRS